MQHFTSNVSGNSHSKGYKVTMEVDWAQKKLNAYRQLI